MTRLDRLDDLIDGLLRAARIPGAAIAVVADGATVLARGYGHCDLQARRPLTAQTVYPIGSTTKAFNAVLLGTLAEQGKIEWDAPVQRYLPRFRLGNEDTSAQVTLRDLITLRTGLPRHDWVWLHNPLTREELVERIRYLELSAGFRQRFQYNNITVTAAGHVAEVVAGQEWEELIERRILEPLEMLGSSCRVDAVAEPTPSYHETTARQLVPTKRSPSATVAPAGSAMHSSVEDMARWIAFNLRGHSARGTPLVGARTLAEIHRPQLPAAGDAAAPTADAAYAMGWFVDTYNGCARLSHSGYIGDVNSDVMFFPGEGIGLVSFVNFAGARLAPVINQHAFDLIMGFATAQSLERALAQYEHKIQQMRERRAALRQQKTSAAGQLDEYVGGFGHAAYGCFEVCVHETGLVLERGALRLPLEHWHGDDWGVAPNDLFEIHKAHAFDGTNPVRFARRAGRDVAALSIRLEPTVAPIRFDRR